jgi:hypothetical protein
MPLPLPKKGPAGRGGFKRAGRYRGGLGIFFGLSQNLGFIFMVSTDSLEVNTEKHLEYYRRGSVKSLAIVDSCNIVPLIQY